MDSAIHQWYVREVGWHVIIVTQLRLSLYYVEGVSDPVGNVADDELSSSIDEYDADDEDKSERESVDWEPKFSIIKTETGAKRQAKHNQGTYHIHHRFTHYIWLRICTGTLELAPFHSWYTHKVDMRRY